MLFTVSLTHAEQRTASLSLNQDFGVYLQQQILIGGEPYNSFALDSSFWILESFLTIWLTSDLNAVLKAANIPWPF